MNNKWVSFSPHIKSTNSTTKIYITMMALLCPVLAGCVVTLGIMPLVTVLVSILTAMVTDVIFKLIVDKKYDFSEISAIFIGLVIGLAMPTGASWWVPILGTIVSIVFIRDIAGGIGQNFVSEIAVSVLLSYLIYTVDFYVFRLADGGTTTKSLLDLVLSGELVDINLGALLFGGYGGTIAESSAFWLIIAGFILMALKIIDFRVTLSVLISTFVFSILFFDVTSAVNLLFAGGVLLSAFFIATDYAVVPKNKWAKYVYGLLIGLLTVILWKTTKTPMAVMYAVLIMGLVGCVFNGVTRTIKNRRV